MDPWKLWVSYIDNKGGSAGAKYEAYIVRLLLSKELRSTEVTLKSDSQLKNFKADILIKLANAMNPG
ncbi:hypothetical protein Lal_00042294, partial [Lupinus albus]